MLYSGVEVNDLFGRQCHATVAMAFAGSAREDAVVVDGQVEDFSGIPESWHGGRG